MVDLNFIRIK